MSSNFREIFCSDCLKPDCIGAVKPFQAQTLYELLEISVSATEAEIRSAFERLVHLYSDDQVALYGLIDEPRAIALRARLQEAFETLCDDERRDAYDVSLGLPPREGARMPVPMPPVRPRSLRPAAPDSPGASTGSWGAYTIVSTGPVAPLPKATPGVTWSVPMPSAPSSRHEDEVAAPARAQLERHELEHIDAARLEVERREAEVAEATLRLEAERVETERREAEVHEAERRMEERLEVERIENERREAERREHERLESERRDAQRAEAEQLAKARHDAERVDFDKPERVEDVRDTAHSLAPRDSTETPQPAPVFETEAGELPVALLGLGDDVSVALARVTAREYRPESKPAPYQMPEGVEVNGDLLRQVRMARGLTLVQVSERTRISVRHLENVEGDKYDQLPAVVYLRGILMNLARELGIDGLRVAKSYLSFADAHRSKSKD